jgi:hypothetical protein
LLEFLKIFCKKMTFVHRFMGGFLVLQAAGCLPSLRGNRFALAIGVCGAIATRLLGKLLPVL